MKKYLVVNLTKHSIPIVIKTVDGQKFFTFTLGYNKTAELFESQISSGIKNLIYRKFIRLEEIIPPVIEQKVVEINEPQIKKTRKTVETVTTQEIKIEEKE